MGRFMYLKLVHMKLLAQKRNLRQMDKPFVSWGPYYQHRLTLIRKWISDNMSSKVWDKITYPFLNFNGCIVEVWEWISNFND